MNQSRTEMEDEIEPISVGLSDAMIAKQLAAESIQSTFRRYRECKPEIMMRKKKSAETLVMNLAAETITSSLRRMASSRSRSRSRMHSETSSLADLTTTQRVPISLINNAPTAANTANASDSMQMRVLRLCNLSVSGVPSVVWQGSNHLYCVVATKDWTHRTEAIYDQKGSAAWPTCVIDIPLLDRDGKKVSISSIVLNVAIMHENLVVADKTIGVADALLTSILPSASMVDKGENYGEEVTAPAECILTAYEGEKFKKKPRGTVKFSAALVQCEFNPARNPTKLTAPSPGAEKPEFRIDSASASIATRSLDPYGIREDSLLNYDFSSAQLRDAADLLHSWEDPANMCDSSVSIAAPQAAVATVSSQSKQLESTIEKFAKKSVPKESPVRSTPISVQEQARKQSIASEKRKVTEQTPARDTGNKNTGNAQSNATAGGTVKTATRLKARRTVIEGSDQNHKSKPRSGSISVSAPAAPPVSVNEELKPPPPRPSNISTDIKNKNQSVLNGTQAIDEAVRLAVRKKGAFVKLTQTEFARLLKVLHYPVRLNLLRNSEPLSNMISAEANIVGVAKNIQKRYQGDDDECKPESEELINLPVLHAMSLAATISFAVRDGDYLSSNESTTAAVEHDGALNLHGLVAMTEEQAERAMEQLKFLLAGDYLQIKNCILRLCIGQDAAAAAPTTTREGKAGAKSRDFPPVSIKDKEHVRPSSWSNASVNEFLCAVNVSSKCIDASSPDGALLLQSDQTSLQRHIGHNPSIDQARLGVYVQALRYIDQWWDRGIRPGDALQSNSTAGEGEGEEVDRTRKAKKRRGSKQQLLDTHSNKWGDLSEILCTLPQISEDSPLQGGMKIVDGGRVLQTHLLKIADFQPLLEALTPLNRAFGWSCSMESLVRFSSIIGGMRGYLWLKPGSYHTEDRPKSSNMSISNISNTSSMEELRSHTSWTEGALTSELACWVVLQKSSALSTTELTQLVRLGNDLNAIMKYTAREDDFLAYVPIGCLRITSVHEIKAQRFEAELQGLLLEDLCVGKYVVVAGLDALTRTCERFDWWDRPTPAILRDMSGQVGEVVSLSEAQSKRRVGVRLSGSGLCDALPIEALRLCTAEEFHAIQEGNMNITNNFPRPPSAISSTGVTTSGGVGGGTVHRQSASAVANSIIHKTSTAAGRRKSKSVNSESRKNKLRNLIRHLNTHEGDDDEDDERDKHVVDVPKKEQLSASAPVTAKISRTKVKKNGASTGLVNAVLTTAPSHEPSKLHIDIDEGTVKSDLSNLSGEDEDEKEVIAAHKSRSDSVKKNKRPSFTSKLCSSSPLASPIPNKTVKPDPLESVKVAQNEQKQKKQQISPAAVVPPQKRIVRRRMVRNVEVNDSEGHMSDSPFPLSPHMGDQSAPPTQAHHLSEAISISNNNKRYNNLLDGEDLESGRLVVNTDGPLDYSWLREPKRSPLVFPVEVPSAPAPPPPAIGRPTSDNPLKPAPTISVVKACFDEDHAEYTDGVLRYTLPAVPEYGQGGGEEGNNKLNISEARPGTSHSFQNRFVPRKRPNSAPATRKNKSDMTSGEAPHSPNREQEELVGIEGNNSHTVVNSSFGLSGVGYVTGGGLQKHPNLWVNDNISALAEADIPKTIPNKKPLGKKEYRNNTQKLFEFHDRNLRFPSEKDPFSEGDGHIPVIEHLGSPSRPVPTLRSDRRDNSKATVRIPQRPKSANPISQGVSRSASSRPAGVDDLEAAVNASLNISAEVVAGAGNAYTRKPTDNEKTSKPKRTREEELHQIAAARSSREQDLKEKVLMKELKRLQNNNNKSNSSSGGAGVKEKMVV